MKSLCAAVVLTLAAMAAGPSRAETVDDVRGTIAAQLEAFRSDDAAAAYALAAPSIKKMFPTPERFIKMVRQGYGPIYDARAPVFLRAKAIDDDNFAQEVGFTDADGQAWTALYTLSRQDDGGWKITGCYLRKAEGQNI